jgi:hypothetical protein
MVKATEPNNTDNTNTPQRAHQAKENAITHNVDIVIDFNTENQAIGSLALINNEYWITARDQGITLKAGSNILSVPSGTYDIIVIFFQQDWKQEDPYLYSMYVIREQTTVDRDMQLNISSSEAKNHIHFQTITPNGEPVSTGKWSVDDNYTNWIELELRNTDDLWFYKKIYCKDYGELVSTYGSFGRVIEGGVHHSVGMEDDADFFVNDVSDRYAFYSHRVGFKGLDFFTTAYEVEGASGDITVTNDPSEYALFTDPFVINNHQNENLYPTFTFYVAEGNGYPPYLTIWLASPLSEGDIMKFYIGAKAETSNVGFIPFIEPSVTTEQMLFGVIPNHIPALVSMRLTSTNGEVIFANNGVASISTRDLMANGSPDFSDVDVTRLPLFSSYNPAFSHSVEKKAGILGDNCPVLVCAPSQDNYIDEWEDDEGNIISDIYYTLSFNYDYIGRFGEGSDDWRSSTNYKLIVNGEELSSGNDSYLELDEPIDGEADICLTGGAFKVDDMPSLNTTKMHFTTSSEDQCSPTMTMLHFMANNGDVTDRFETAEDGTLEFSAGDFNLKHSPQDWYYYDRYAPESVEVSYSPYGEDNWNELPVEEVPENYWPVMGWFYTGSLAGVTGEAYEGWFDLKIRLVDAAGNWQEQVLSPAFRIDNLAYSGIATPRGNNAREVARYSIDGKRVDASHHGVTIIKMSDGTAKKMIVQ